MRILFDEFIKYLIKEKCTFINYYKYQLLIHNDKQNQLINTKIIIINSFQMSNCFRFEK
jgi:hypothetical protein